VQVLTGMYFYPIKEAQQQFVQNNFLSMLINLQRTLKIDCFFIWIQVCSFFLKTDSVVSKHLLTIIFSFS